MLRVSFKMIMGVCLEDALVGPKGNLIPHSVAPFDDVAQGRFAKLDVVYEEQGLVKNIDKDLRRAFKGVLWGCCM